MRLRIRAALCAAALPLTLSVVLPLPGAAGAMTITGEPTAAVEFSPAAPAAARASGNEAAASAMWNGMMAHSRAQYVEARSWYAKAAQAGDPLAVASLASLLDRGLGGPRDAAAAAAWIRHGAKTGDAASMTRYAERLRQGIGVERDAGMSVAWLRKAAALGDVEARMMLASMLEQGEGTARDAVGAYGLGASVACSLEEHDEARIAPMRAMQDRLEAELSSAEKAMALRLADRLSAADAAPCRSQRASVELVNAGLWTASAATLGIHYWLATAFGSMAA